MFMLHRYSKIQITKFKKKKDLFNYLSHIFFSPAMHPHLLLFFASRYLSKWQTRPHENLQKMPVTPKVTTPQSPHQL